jgi:sirohydrochlorin ferrochelatase
VRNIDYKHLKMEIIVKPSLVVAAHGSRSELATAEIFNFTNTLDTELKPFYNDCKPAFLEMSAPSIQSSITELIEAGATQIHILPYFLTSGVHVRTDIPAIVNKLTQQFCKVQFTLLKPIGLASQMLNVVTSVVHEEFSKDLKYKKPANNDNHGHLLISND